MEKSKGKAKPSFTISTGSDEYELSASGVLLYRTNPDTSELELLVIYSRNNYEDFGGRVDLDDQSIAHTAAREAWEESNELFWIIRPAYL